MADLAVDIVGVIGDATGQGGTGHVVAENLVLTARHTIAPKGQAPGSAKIYPWRPNQPGHLVEIAAAVAWAPATAAPDAALLRLTPPAGQRVMPARPIRFGDCPQAGTLAADTAGFPVLDRAAVRFDDRLVLFPGTAWKADQAALDGSFSLGFTSERELAGDPAGWKGLSGAALFCGDLLVGVFREFPTAFNARRELAVESIERLLRDAAFCGLVGWTVGAPLPRALPPPPPPVALPPKHDLPALAAYLYTLNRNDELNVARFAIRKAAGQCPVEILVSGKPDDLCDQFVLKLAEEAWIAPLPERMEWPGRAMIADGGEWQLADHASSRLGLGGAEDFRQLRALLQTSPLPPWLWLDLPVEIDAHDLVLLEQWRSAWSGLARADGKGFGWVLSWSGKAAPPPTLVLPPQPGLRQAVARLGPITRAEVEKWDLSLQALVQRRARAGIQAPPWPMLARQAVSRLDVKDAYPLAELLRLLESPASRAPSAEAAWETA